MHDSAVWWKLNTVLALRRKRKQHRTSRGMGTGVPALPSEGIPPRTFPKQFIDMLATLLEVPAKQLTLLAFDTERNTVHTALVIKALDLMTRKEPPGYAQSRSSRCQACPARGAGA